MRAWLGVTLVALSGCMEAASTSVPSGQSEGDAPGLGTSTAPLLEFRPVVGGHLALSRDATRIAMVDPDANRVRFYSLSTLRHEASVGFGKGAWPTRVAEGSDGAFYVLLRGLGAVARLTRGVSGWGYSQTAVCPEPRALSFDEAAGELNVGCAGGELVRFDAALQVLARRQTGVEWRDLSVASQQVEGISFRAAELISASGDVEPVPQQLPGQTFTVGQGHVPRVAWRLMTSGTRRVVVHQLHAESLQVDTAPRPSPDAGFASGGNPYGGGAASFLPCPQGAAVVTGITVLSGGQVEATFNTVDVLPVDAALSADGSRLAIAGAGGSGLRSTRCRWGLPSAAA